MLEDDEGTPCEVCGKPCMWGSRHHGCGADLMVLDAMLRHALKASRAWRDRRFLYNALEHFHSVGDYPTVWLMLLRYYGGPELGEWGLGSSSNAGVRTPDGSQHG